MEYTKSKTSCEPSNSNKKTNRFFKSNIALALKHAKRIKFEALIDFLALFLFF